MHHFARLVAPKLCTNNKFARLVAPPVKKSLRKIASGASNFSSFQKLPLGSVILVHNKHFVVVLIEIALT